MGNTKTVSQLDVEGYFVAAVLAHESPLEPGVFLLPAGAVDRAPPVMLEQGKRYRVWGAGWRGEALPVAEAPAPAVEPTAEQLRQAEIVQRLAAIDGESVRPAREVAIALAMSEPLPAFAVNKLAALESEAAALRVELAALVL